MKAVYHKSSVVKGTEITFSYAVEDESWTKVVSFTMPLAWAIKALWLSPIAIHQAYASEGRERVAKALDSHYFLLKKEGYRAEEIRQNDLAFYRMIVAESNKTL